MPGPRPFPNSIMLPHQSPKFAFDLKSFAKQQGFDLCGLLPVSPPRTIAPFQSALARGDFADMHYLETSLPIRINPSLLSPAPQSVVVLALRYPLGSKPPVLLPDRWAKDRRFGLIARYAWGSPRGRDYHKVIKKKLNTIDQWVRAQTGRTIPAKGWTDSGPVLERDLAERAGIGFVGKNTCSIHSVYGSWFFLASLWLPEALYVDFETLAPTRANVSDPHPVNSPLIWLKGAKNGERNMEHQQKSRVGSCGSCEKCLVACPTGALKPYQLDARRCISYWTIESSQPAPEELSRHFGRWLFGCDICQEVCPWNAESPPDSKASITSEDTEGWRQWLYPLGGLMPLQEGFDPRHPYWLDEACFLEKFQGTPIMRAGREKMRQQVERVMRLP